MKEVRIFIFDTLAREHCKSTYLIEEKDWDSLIGPDLKFKLLFRKIMDDPEYKNNKKLIILLEKQIFSLLDSYIKRIQKK